MVYLSPNPCHQSPHPHTKITSRRLFASQLSLSSFTNITQLRPVHDGIDLLIPGPWIFIDSPLKVHQLNL